MVESDVLIREGPTATRATYRLVKFKSRRREGAARKQRPALPSLTFDRSTRPYLSRRQTPLPRETFEILDLFHPTET